MIFLNPNAWDIVLGGLLLVIILEGARRAIGFLFPLLGVMFFIYAIWGPIFPGILQHKGFEFTQMVSVLYIGQLGILQGSLLSVSAKTVAIFIIFGSILLVTGGGSMFIKIALALTGRLVGGPAKVATVASAFFGTISGSTAANTATTGVFTIPLMKDNGYRSEFAGGVESAASCGGQIMPPHHGCCSLYYGGIDTNKLFCYSLNCNNSSYFIFHRDMGISTP